MYFSLSVLLLVLLILFPIRLLLCSVIFCSKMLFPCHQVVGMSSYILLLLASRIFFVVLECPVLSILLFPLFRYLFSPPSFTSTFGFISSSCIVCLTCVAFYFLFQQVPALFLCLIIFLCCQRFLICISCRISYPGLEIRLCSFREYWFFFTGKSRPSIDWFV